MNNTTNTNTITTTPTPTLEENPAVGEIKREIEIVFALIKREGLDLPWVERILDDELEEIGAYPPIQNLIRS